MVTIGATAKLKSGGPVMTVVKHTAQAPSPQTGVPAIPEMIECWWFDENTLYKADFPPGSLDVTEDKAVDDKAKPAHHKAGDK